MRKDMNAKIKTIEEILEICSKLKIEGKSIVTTNGSFDVLHAAHVRILEKAKQEGDILIVLLNSDSSIKKLKGPNRPIINEKERAYMIASLECVDYALIFNEDNPLEILRQIKPHKHVKGGTFVSERIKEEEELVSEWGGEFRHFEVEEGYSTTNIIKNVLEKYSGENGKIS